MSIAPWSFSKIKSFEQCPKKFYHLKVLKNYRESETEAMLYGTAVHLAAEEYIRDGTPLPEKYSYCKDVLDSLNAKAGEKICELEMGLTEDLEPCGFRDDAVWWRGIADLVILNRDTKTAWIIDYKTSKNTRYADKGQLELMALAVFKHYPEIEHVKGGLVFVVCGELVTGNYEKSEEPTLWAKWLSDYSRMEKAFEKDVWNAHQSGLCRRHCIVTECVHNGRH
jgi:CRISPR/Cas system-associated exonuclease Cas4 (RecB family)|tara:strand:- start:201 stop:872 length:672 start_codon:yes stop_codon:yes gene_type:complete